MKEIDSRADELVEMMKRANQEFVERKLAVRDYRPPDIDGTADAILDGLRDFPRVVAEGTIEERKAFVRTFISGILLHPHERHAVIRIRRFPLPAGANSGNSSFGRGARARSEPATCPGATESTG